MLFFLVWLKHPFCAAHISVAHLPISRRGGPLAGREPANLTSLKQILHDVETRYLNAKREVRGNKLVRKWRSRSSGTTEDLGLLSTPGHEGSW